MMENSFFRFATKTDLGSTWVHPGVVLMSVRFALGVPNLVLY